MRYLIALVALVFASCGGASQTDRIVTHCNSLCGKLDGCDSSPYAQYCGSCAQLQLLASCEDEIEAWLVCLDAIDNACSITDSTCAAETNAVTACNGGNAP